KQNPRIIPSRAWENTGLKGNEGFLQLYEAIYQRGTHCLFGQHMNFPPPSCLWPAQPGIHWTCCSQRPWE
ncbi:hypothetical protein Nmel_018422, partial [Mimus melanotis]